MLLPVYELRHADKTLVTFAMGRPEKRLKVEGTRLADDAASLLPWGLDPSDDGMCHWLKKRVLPINRCYASRVCAAMGIKYGDVEGIIKTGMGLGLNDDYWIVPAGSPLRFADMTPYTNAFPEAVAAAGFTGEVDESADPACGASPDLVTNGSINKGWRIASDGTRKLYKGTSEGFEAPEWLSECMASQLAEIMGVNHVAYHHERWLDRDASVCDCFCDPEVSFVPLSVVAGRASLENALAAARILGPQAIEDLADILVLDAVTCNVDRHFGNIGLMYDASTRKVMRFAPAFDNGRAFYPNFATADLADASALLAGSRPAFGAQSFDELAAAVIGPRQLQKVGRLVDFEGFTGIAEDQAERAGAVAALVRERARMLVKLESTDRKAILG